ncbi:MAG: IS110 family transposase [Planctomycetaceae bacterium]|nr:IS110 family transposase [Planctomycetaceae bacterium]MBV8611505.1 IS110 family transposase [Singulisphaera sp.]
MDVLHACCAGLDVHKRTVVACVRRVDPAGKVFKNIKTFATMTQDLLNLSDWLAAQGVTTVAMESTGTYWKPVFNLLEPRFAVVLVNAHHIKQVPGRKTDVKDSEWIAQLLQHGLLRPSFIPPRPTRELRDLTRQRTQLTAEKTAVANRIQKVLEDANIKLGSVASDVLGVSGRDMIEAIIRGEFDPVKLADLARRRLRGKIPQLQLALEGSVTEHHRFLLRTQMDHLNHLERLIRRYDERIAEVLDPFAEQVGRLMTIPGIDHRVAEIVLAEIGLEMARFPTAGHLSSWAGLSSGNHESAGKRRSGGTTPGNRWLKSALVQSAWAAYRAKGTHLSRKFRRIAGNRGKKRAAVAVAHTLLVIIYHLLRDGTNYQEIAGDSEAA